jgi:hypothetical protein
MNATENNVRQEWLSSLSPKVRVLLQMFGTADQPETEELPAYAWPGGYPLFYLDSENNVLCPTCANKLDMSTGVTEYDVNWEDNTLYCDDCSARIESAYGEED